ncbi:hypothetical protein H4Q26_005246 [Puccinia striiformis f. sp. tritici PST-130]|nr:hypothetical protein H4Q26_005246 [Puccinia striiformis f. sp. tritici PST-130]
MALASPSRKVREPVGGHSSMADLLSGGRSKTNISPWDPIYNFFVAPNMPLALS